MQAMFYSCPEAQGAPEPVTITITGQEVSYYFSKDPNIGFPDPSDCTETALTFCNKDIKNFKLEAGLWKIYLLFKG